jgi:hypothetical protein
MKNILISVMSLICGLLSAQECKIDLYSLAQPDNNMVRFNKFGQSRTFKVVLSDGFDTIANKEIIYQLSQWFLNQNSSVSTVNINDIKMLDDSCHYLIIGLTGNLKDLSVFDLPLTLKDNRWSLGPIELTNSDDAIETINVNAQCSAVIGNSYAALRNMSNGRFLGLYDYYILKKNKMSYMGNLKENTFIPNGLVDLALIRKENYSQKIDNEYLEAVFSCKYKTTSQFQVTIDSLIDSFTEFCGLYKVSRPSQKLKFFIHTDQSEINLVSGDPKPGSTGGFVIDSLIHTVGINKELLIHEGVHYIFNSNSRSHNAFFNEGIPMSFALFEHHDRITNDCKLIKDNLEIQDLITGKATFWMGPYKDGQCLSYPISGLFVKFLIDKYGMDKLKRFYQCGDIVEGFKTVYNMDLQIIISEWKNFVLSNIK